MFVAMSSRQLCVKDLQPLEATLARIRAMPAAEDGVE